MQGQEYSRKEPHARRTPLDALGLLLRPFPLLGPSSLQVWTSRPRLDLDRFQMFQSRERSILIEHDIFAPSPTPRDGTVFELIDAERWPVIGDLQPMDVDLAIGENPPLCRPGLATRDEDRWPSHREIAPHGFATLEHGRRRLLLATNHERHAEQDHSRNDPETDSRDSCEESTFKKSSHRFTLLIGSLHITVKLAFDSDIFSRHDPDFVRRRWSRRIRLGLIHLRIDPRRILVVGFVDVDATQDGLAVLRD